MFQLILHDHFSNTILFVSTNSPARSVRKLERRSSRPPVIVIERSAESLPDLDTALGLRDRSADEPVSNALVAALIMVVLHELVDRMVE
jgi:hypothetical protein